MCTADLSAAVVTALVTAFKSRMAFPKNSNNKNRKSCQVRGDTGLGNPLRPCVFT